VEDIRGRTDSLRTIILLLRGRTDSLHTIICALFMVYLMNLAITVRIPAVGLPTGEAFRPPRLFLGTGSRSPRCRTRPGWRRRLALRGRRRRPREGIQSEKVMFYNSYVLLRFGVLLLVSS